LWRSVPFGFGRFEQQVFRFHAGEKLLFYDKIGESSGCQPVAILTEAIRRVNAIVASLLSGLDNQYEWLMNGLAECSPCHERYLFHFVGIRSFVRALVVFLHLCSAPTVWRHFTEEH
jgi:hypothetical protein